MIDDRCSVEEMEFLFFFGNVHTIYKVYYVYFIPFHTTIIHYIISPHFICFLSSPSSYSSAEFIFKYKRGRRGREFYKLIPSFITQVINGRHVRCGKEKERRLEKYFYLYLVFSRADSMNTNVKY